jgi:hypothetical protein
MFMAGVFALLTLFPLLSFTFIVWISVLRHASSLSIWKGFWVGNSAIAAERRSADAQVFSVVGYRQSLGKQSGNRKGRRG